jgi:hypothetical protein
MRQFLVGLLAAGMMLAWAPPALAQTDLFNDACRGAAANSAVCRDRQKSQNDRNNSFYGRNGVLVKVANLLAIITGIAAVIMIIVGGIRYVLSSGDPSNINAAKNMIIFAIVGLVIVAAARSIIVLVINAL